ncbi:MAG TPA: glycosyltransferase family 9 protein [Bryobacteraceae bacterium]|nr:glycosyltransferase family 9 protein [Bryobacteraceae bacterium]
MEQTGRALDRLPRGSRMAIVRLRSMGDCVLTTPAIEILHRERPDLEIGVVVEDRFRAIFEGNPSVAAILRPELTEIFRWCPALCLNLHGGRRSMLLTLASRAAIRAGFAHHRGALLYHTRIPRAQEILGAERPVHTAEHLASAMFYLGCPAQEIPRARLYASPTAGMSPYAILHPVAAAQYKTWPADRFVAVAEHVRRVYALEPMLIGGAGDDMTPFRSFRTVVGAPLAGVVSLIAGASLFIGNDSGPAHIAAAFDRPLVVLYGRPEHLITWAPWRATSAATLVDAHGISAIRTDDVIAAVDRIHVPR